MRQLKYILLILLIPTLSLLAQKEINTNSGSGLFDHYKIGAGLNVFSIVAGDNNLNTASLMPIASEEGDLVIGGQMGGGHPGYHIQFTAYLDKEEDYKIPIGVSHNFLNAAQTRPAASQGILTRYNHNIDLIKINAGFQFAFWDLDSSEAKVYIGPEFMYSFITNSLYVEKFDNLSPNEPDIEVARLSKANATRIGGMIRLGVEGHLHQRVYINVGLGLGVLNLFGRDDERGELFTYTNKIEVQESYVTFLDFSLVIQYHL